MAFIGGLQARRCAEAEVKNCSRQLNWAKSRFSISEYARPTRCPDDLRRRSGAAELRGSRAAVEPLTGFRHPWGRGARGAVANPTVQSHDPLGRTDGCGCALPRGLPATAGNV